MDNYSVMGGGSNNRHDTDHQYFVPIDLCCKNVVSINLPYHLGD